MPWKKNIHIFILLQNPIWCVVARKCFSLHFYNMISCTLRNGVRPKQQVFLWDTCTANIYTINKKEKKNTAGIGKYLNQQASVPAPLLKETFATDMQKKFRSQQNVLRNHLWEETGCLTSIGTEVPTARFKTLDYIILYLKRRLRFQNGWPMESQSKWSIRPSAMFKRKSRKAKVNCLKESKPTQLLQKKKRRGPEWLNHQHCSQRHWQTCHKLPEMSAEV